jgi:hypothetical protein
MMSRFRRELALMRMIKNGFLWCWPIPINVLMQKKKKKKKKKKKN